MRVLRMLEATRLRGSSCGMCPSAWSWRRSSLSQIPSITACFAIPVHLNAPLATVGERCLKGLLGVRVRALRQGCVVA